MKAAQVQGGAECMVQLLQHHDSKEAACQCLGAELLPCSKSFWSEENIWFVDLEGKYVMLQ